MPDPFKILKDLELMATNLDADQMKQQEGYLVAWRSGLPIRKEDFNDPWDPTTPAVVAAAAANTDPKDAKTSGTKENGVDPTKEQVYADILKDLSRAERAFVNTFMLTTVKLEMNSQYRVMPGSSNVFDTWWAIVTGANGVPDELELTPEMQQAYDKAQSVLTTPDDEPTPAYLRYDKYSDEYNAATDAYTKAWTAAAMDPVLFAQFPMTGVPLRKNVDRAFDRWMGLGSKSKIEGALAVISAQGQDPSMALINRAKKNLESNLFEMPGVGLLPRTIIIPSTWADASVDDGWSTYTQSSFQHQTHITESSTSLQAGAGIEMGFWHAGGNLDSESQKTQMQIDTTDLEISFDFMVADVYSPVIKPNLLNLQNWFLYGDYDKNCISTGKLDQLLPADGTEHVFMPSLITGLIFVRNFSLKWGNWKSSWDEKTKDLAAGGSVGYGPFAIKGQYGNGTHSFDANTDNEAVGLQVSGMQLIGYVSQIMPSSPSQSGSDHLQKPPAPQPAP